MPTRDEILAVLSEAQGRALGVAPFAEMSAAEYAMSQVLRRVADALGEPHEAVAWQIKLTGNYRGWEECTKECFDLSRRSGRYLGLDAGTKEFELRELYLAAHESERTGWRPIETAPKDGTPVDLWHKAGFRQTETWWDASDECWSSVNDDSAFTHWMPLPAPPEQTP